MLKFPNNLNKDIPASTNSIILKRKKLKNE